MVAGHQGCRRQAGMNATAPRPGRASNQGRSISAIVEGFGCRPIAALRLGPRPASESRQGRNPREMSGGGAASAALWIFVYDGSACWQPTLMSVLADDVAAHDGSVAGR